MVYSVEGEAKGWFNSCLKLPTTAQRATVKTLESNSSYSCQTIKAGATAASCGLGVLGRT